MCHYVIVCYFVFNSKLHNYISLYNNTSFDTEYLKLNSHNFIEFALIRFVTFVFKDVGMRRNVKKWLQICELGLICNGFRDIDWPRDRLCADVGGAGAHLSHSRCWLVLKARKFFWKIRIWIWRCSFNSWEREMITSNLCRMMFMLDSSKILGFVCTWFLLALTNCCWACSHWQGSSCVRRHYRVDLDCDNENGKHRKQLTVNQ